MTTPRAGGGRVTRSSAAQIATNASEDGSPPQQAPASIAQRSTRPSTKRPRTPVAGTQARRSKRTRHRSGYYEESDSDDELGDDYETSPSREVESSARPASSLRRTPRKTATPRSVRRETRAVESPTKRRALNPTPRKRTPRKADPLPDPTPVEPPVIPDWLSLPYLIWVEIFSFAFAQSPGRDGVDWLLATSRVCRTFAEPALTALYQSPPLLTRPMAHNLIGLLSRDPSTTTFNYRRKVEKLRIDVEEVAAKTYRGQPLDFQALITCLPRLKVIDFTHRKDQPPFRMLEENLRWHYPDSLFAALNAVKTAPGEDGEARPTKLTGFRWNRRMMGPGLDLERIKTLHTTPAFSGLKRLGFVNYQVPSLLSPGRDEAEANAQDQAFIRGLADAASVLPELEHLSFESSTAVNDESLSLLPKSIRSLELINCWEVRAEDLSEYLLSHGHKMEHLNLCHNQSLSLGFLTVLGAACPNLRTLCVDLKTFNHHEFYRDSDPLYDEVLNVAQIPNWPEGIETVDLRNMRKWSAEGAETLFQSLVDSAPRLRSLRRLHLKSMLDIPFRQRSILRDKWEAKLRYVFLRKEEDPKPVFPLRRKPLVEPSPAAAGAAEKVGKENFRQSEGKTRRSTRIAQAPGASSRESSIGRDLSGVRRGKLMYVEVDTDEDEDSQPAGSQDGMDGGLFRQGMCETVEIQLDNQKPAETILQMDDFLDEEASDDLSDEDFVDHIG
ncbi:hypothetical protein QBC47DRAFT_369326 [Echria macrotheca]|uniref:F-box domain-containing protein n=1 Tax=Echria macrotheca TaxID=438768 RepID=A0AAJ0BMS7_9PEZI|nr:hypothetical protein QBC47DRAFT_369326 [Echria macrotheca]